MPHAYPDNTDRFSGRAEAYTKYRPGYAKNVLDFIAQTLPLKQNDTILDMGSGTGILSKVLLEDFHDTLGVSVIGLEPNADMRVEQDKFLAQWAAKGCFKTVAGTAEVSTLPDASADVAFAAAAFHWFDGPSAREEVLRVVKSRDGKGAPVALLTRSPDFDVDKLGPEFDRAKLLHQTFFEIREHLGLNSTILSLEAKFSDDALDIFFGGKGRWTAKHFQAIRPLTWEQLRGMIHSFSSAPKEGTPEHDEVCRRLKVMFDEHQIDGKVDMLRASMVVYGQVQ